MGNVPEPACSTLFLLWKVMGLLTKNSTTEQWAATATDLYNKGLYEEAVACFERANDDDSATRAKVGDAQRDLQVTTQQGQRCMPQSNRKTQRWLAPIAGTVKK